MATKEDINELIRMRIAYMIDDFGSITEQERNGMETQLHKRATYLNFKIN